jgi:D-alanyl-lipoteichoic acid acyltransferase DltB (MBOAT superfamily)
VLFPTIRFAIFFAVVLPASWALMPLPNRWLAERSRRGTTRPDGAETAAWVVPTALLALAAVLGPLAPWSGPAALTGLGWLAAAGLGGLAVVRWIDLAGFDRWKVFVLVASYVFYGAYAWHYVALLAASTVVNQVLTVAIHRNRVPSTRRVLLAVGVAVNLGLLAWFKYKGFFVETASSILDPFGVELTPPARAVIPPVGISFFTFQALSYLIDTYRRQIAPASFLDFAVFLAFFPQVVAGPIVRAAEFLPQLRTPRDARTVDTGLAFWLIAAGLFKKVVVSSYLADAVVDPVFRIPSQHDAVDTLLGIYGYAIQIYCDFSGYTDMAIGLALLLGFRFPQNFDAPYTAVTLQDFWRRWHMTLSRWLRDYLYIPLGGSQRGPSRAYVNLFLTMLIGGLWHGAAWTFVAWGALHGGYLAAERWWTSRPPSERRPGDDVPVLEPVLAAGEHPPPGPDGGGVAALAQPRPVDALVAGPADRLRAAIERVVERGPTLSPPARRWVGRLVTFHVVCLGWVFFRSPTLSEAFEVLGRLASPGTGTGVNLVVVATIATFLATQFVPPDAVGRAQAWFSRRSGWQQGVALAVFLMVTSALSPTGVAPFIYFAF